jgi:acyl-CoA synthetase (AMP-forming)/AMP-acid ligase II
MTSGGVDLVMGRLMADIAVYGDRPALVFPDGQMSYAELSADSNRLANALTKLGLVPGDRFAFLLPNDERIVCCYLACAKSGVVGVPLGTRLTPDDLVHQLNDSGAVTVLYASEWESVMSDLRGRAPNVTCWISENGSERAERYDALLRDAEDGAPGYEPQGDDPFCVMYTGGTTGVSKAAIQTQRGWAACVLDTVEQLGISSSDRHAVVLPMTHAAWFTVAAHLHAGATTHILPRWDPEAMLDLVQQERLTKLHMIPSLLGDLLALDPSGLDLSHIGLITLAGSPIPAEMYRRARDVFGAVIGNIYGLTEASGPVTYLMPRDMADTRIHSAGRPGRYSEVLIADETGNPLKANAVGEVLLRGPQITPGYLNRPDENQNAFIGDYFCTGDIGYLDEEGFLFIIDRKKDMIKTGGLNVYPKEIEDVLYDNPGVLEAAVIGVPHPRWIEAVVAVVTLDDRPGSATPDDLEAACRRRLSGYKVPKSIYVLDALPRTLFGKFDKLALREKYSALP